MSPETMDRAIRAMQARLDSPTQLADEAWTASPSAASMSVLVDSASYNYGVWLAALRLDRPMMLRRLSALVHRQASGTSRIALALYRLDPNSLRDPPDLSLRTWTLAAVPPWSGAGPTPTVTPVTSAGSGAIARVDQDVPPFKLGPDSLWYVGVQVSDSSAWLQTAPNLLTGSNVSLAPGFGTHEVGARPGDFPARLTWRANSPLPVVVAQSLRGIYHGSGL